MTEIPFTPSPRDWEGFPMPPSVPAGMRLELSRSKVLPGQEEEAEAWMAMLNDRYEEAVGTLSAQRAAFEATFLNREADGSLWIYHLALVGEGDAGLDPASSAIDRDHIEHGMRVKMPGWEELRPVFMLTPEHIRDSIARWGATGTA